ncbi:hypothetical protein K2173_002947 [Erythroxylum novogranatense]|uniref:Endonuclease/exonuclease/phosphatase domain-containing protein n=1 Tax=Erythroxylum novogranatense TaxID=1862640 RepID=A0AAV8TRC7_9ROSI|nr:hypothetical protein K2173_002947 [Erythroxylum novogranatense]
MLGVVGTPFDKHIKEYYSEFHPDIVTLVETRISSHTANLVISKLNFSRSHRVEARGFAGGIWIVWNDNIELEVLQNHTQFIHCRVKKRPAVHWVFVSFVYGSPQKSIRKLLWAEFLTIACTMSTPWLLAGDFNAILCRAEKKGSISRTYGGDPDFQNFIFSAGLRDMGLMGPHRPTPRPFRFFPGWLSHEGFGEFVRNSWLPNLRAPEAVERLREKAIIWNKSTFGVLSFRKKRIIARLKGLQRALETHRTINLIRTEIDLRGTADGQAKLALVAWDSCCQPLHHGGLGFRKLREHNKAFLCKLGFRVLSRKNDLWVRILREKYRVGVFIPDSVKWIPELGLLWAHKKRGKLIPHDWKVADVVTHNLDWDWGQLERFLSPLALLHISNVCPPNPFAGEDGIAWQGSKEGIISVSDAYTVMMQPTWDNEAMIWK